MAIRWPQHGDRGTRVEYHSLASAVPLGIVTAIAIPNLFASYRTANEGSAIHSLRLISQAELAYQSNFAKCGTLQELAANGLIDPTLGSGTKNGYKFTVTVDSENPEAFEVTGVPVTYQSSGTRSFYVDETFVIVLRITLVDHQRRWVNRSNHTMSFETDLAGILGTSRNPLISGYGH